MVKEPQTKQWYVIHPMKCDHQHDVPCCMPMKTSRVRDTCTSANYLFTNLRSSPGGCPLRKHPVLLDAKSILKPILVLRHSTVIAPDTGSLLLAPSPASSVPASQHLQPNQRCSPEKLSKPSMAPTCSVRTLPAESADAPDGLHFTFGSSGIWPPLPHSKPAPLQCPWSPHARGRRPPRAQPAD
jgi:hypothetical protein